jgi:hypothetical protein
MRHLLFLLLLCLSLPVQAEMDLVTIELQHRPAAEITSLLQPMLTQGGSISGSGYKLFIKSTPTNIEQLRHLVAQIDVAPAQLLISVSFDREVLQQNKHISARVRVEGNTTLHVANSTERPTEVEVEPDRNKIKYDARLFAGKQKQHSPQIQQVRVTEGLWATIKTGQAIPLASRSRNPDGTVTETITYQAVASGFQVLPRVNGDKVTLTIRPQSQSPSEMGAGAYNTTELDTAVSGKLGEWIALGSVAESDVHSGGGISYYTQQQSETVNQIFIKVESIPK